MVFKNPFFSKKGQKERLANVKSVLGIAIRRPFGGKDRIKAPSKAPKLVKKGLELAANNPLTTAGLGFGAATAIGRTAVKSVLSKAGTAFAGAKFGTQAKIVGAGLVGVPLLAKSKKARQVVAEAPKAPGKLASFGADLGSFIDDPSKATGKKLLSENKLVVGALAATGLVVAAPTIGAAASAAVAGAQRRETTKAVESLGERSFTTSPLPPVKQVTPPSAVGVPTSGATTPVAATEITGGAKTKQIQKRKPSKKSKRKKFPSSSNRNSVKIINVNNSAS